LLYCKKKKKKNKHLFGSSGSGSEFSVDKMTAMASTLFVDDKERWVVLSDKTIRVHKAKGDEKVLSEIALTGVSRDFNVFDDEYKLFLHSGGDSTPAVTVLQTASIVLACDWWFQLTKVAAALSIAGRMSTPLSPLSSKHPNAELITKFYAAFANKDWYRLFAFLWRPLSIVLYSLKESDAKLLCRCCAFPRSSIRRPQQLGSASNVAVFAPLSGFARRVFKRSGK
jgi:hypothetical protein